MGNYENVIKITEIKKRAEEGDLLSAYKILKTVDIRKIKNVADLHLFAEIYSENNEFDEAAQLYLKIYEKVKSRKVLSQLVEVSIKLNNIEDAEYFFDLYQKAAPGDFYYYIYCYKIARLKGESYEQQIEILREFKKIEYIEKWAYELAKLYYKAGMEKECIQECNDIELWFGDGTFVEKAKVLRSYFSGEGDDKNILAEIKRRTGKIDSPDNTNIINPKVNKNNCNNDSGVNNNSSVNNNSVNNDNISNSLEGEINPDVDFLEQEDDQNLAFGLRKDVQDFLTSEEAILPVENCFTTEEEGKNLSENVSREFDEEVPDTAELGIEIECSMEMEEDKKLQQFSKELQFNSEEIFGDFLDSMTIKKQLVQCMDQIIHDRLKTVMLIITGTKGSGKTSLAKNMALFLFKTGKLKSSKVAKITAVKLNTVDIMSKKNTLRDCCLLIDKAGDLESNTVENLIKLIQYLGEDVAVIFEEDKSKMDKLIKDNSILADLLKNKINLS